MALPVELLEESFDLVATQKEELVDRFCARLLTCNPDAEVLLPTDARRCVVDALIRLRKALRDLDAVAPTLTALGAEHARRGISPELYPRVADALIETMAGMGGAQWTPEHSAAWRHAYRVIAATMLSGVIVAGAFAGTRDAHTHA